MPQAPAASAAAHAELPVVLRHAVQMSEIDQMGHMNVQFYVQKSVLAAWVQWAQLGFAHDSWRTPPALQEQHIRFLAELLPGTPFYICGGEVAQSDASQLVLYQELRHSLTHAPCATFTSRWQCADAKGAAAWPAALRKQMPRWRTPIPPHGQARGIMLAPPRTSASRAEAERLGMTTSWLGVLLPAQCDAQSQILDWSYMALISDAIPNLLAQAQKFDPGAEVQKKRGGAALEYRLVYRARAEAGAALCLHSGLRTLGRKTYNWVHWLCDIASGRALATVEAVAVNIDLQARKSLAMDDAQRAALAPLCNDALSV